MRVVRTIPTITPPVIVPTAILICIVNRAACWVESGMVPMALKAVLTVRVRAREKKREKEKERDTEGKIYISIQIYY